MSAVDTLKTVLEMVNNVSAPAEAAATSIDSLSDELRQLIDRLEHAEKKTDELGDEMFQAATIGKAFKDAFQEAGGSPLKGLIDNSTTLGTSLGTQLAPAISSVSAFLAGPGGLAVAAGSGLAAINLLGAGVGFLGSALTSLGAVAQTVLPMLGQGVGMALAMPMMGASSKRDADTRMFASFLGGFDQSRQMMAFIEQYGERSGLDEQPLIDFAKTLSFQNQDVNKFLPVLETLAIAGGGTSEASQRVSEIWRRMMGGQVTEALGSEGLGSLGITKQMLQGVGAQFNRQGSFLGTPEEAAEMLKTLTESNAVMKDLRTNFEGSIQTSQSNFSDAFIKNWRQFTDVIAEGALPILKEFTEGLKDMAASGIPEKLGQIFRDIFGLNGEMKGSFNEIAAGFLATVTTTLQVAKSGVDFILNALAQIDPFLTKVQNALLASDNPIIKAAGVGLAQGRIAFAGFNDFVNDQVLGNPQEGWKASYDEYLKMMNEGTEKRKNAAPATAPLPGDPKAEKATEAQVESSKALQAIKANTDVMAQASIQRMILGGGEVGSFGVTPYRVAVAQGRSTGSPVERAIRGLADALAEDQAIRLMSYDNAIQWRA